MVIEKNTGKKDMVNIKVKNNRFFIQNFLIIYKIGIGGFKPDRELSTR